MHQYWFFKTQILVHHDYQMATTINPYEQGAFITMKGNDLKPNFTTYEGKSFSLLIRRSSKGWVSLNLNMCVSERHLVLTFYLISLILLTSRLNRDKDFYKVFYNLICTLNRNYELKGVQNIFIFKITSDQGSIFYLKESLFRNL